MGFTEDEKNAIVFLRLNNARQTLEDVKIIVNNKLWNTAANRLYYACYYAVSALLVKNNFAAYTHAGVLSQFGLHFVKKGLISKEQGKFYKQLFNLRQSGDYDDWFDSEEKDVMPLLKPAEEFITEIERLC